MFICGWLPLAAWCGAKKARRPCKFTVTNFAMCRPTHQAASSSCAENIDSGTGGTARLPSRMTTFAFASVGSAQSLGTRCMNFAQNFPHSSAPLLTRNLFPSGRPFQGGMWRDGATGMNILIADDDKLEGPTCVFKNGAYHLGHTR